MRMRLDRRSFCRLFVGCALPKLLHASAGDESSEVPKVAIPRKAVESSSIASIGYHRASQVLEIEFHSGALYRYFAVPAAVSDEFQKAGSKGRYFSRRIRGRYQFRRLQEARP